MINLHSSFAYFHLKGFRLPYDAPTMRVVTHLATVIYESPAS